MESIEIEIAKARDLAQTVEHYQPEEVNLQSIEGIQTFLQAETNDINVLVLTEKYIKEAGAWPLN